MSDLRLTRDGWLDGALDDLDEQATFTRLRIAAGDKVLTRAYSKRGGGETESLNLPLLPLASFIAKSWWQLLYEPLRNRNDDTFPARHRLDLAMHGYVFPALALYSAGDESLMVDWARLENQYSTLEFLTSPPREPLQLARERIEPALMDIIESSLERLSSGSRSHKELSDNWQRVRESMESSSQAAYCMAAGRFGIDPYDPEMPDIGECAEHLPDRLFDDLSEAVDISNLVETTRWMREARDRLSGCPTIDVAAFGQPPKDDLQMTAGDFGFRAANILRSRLGLELGNPRRAIAEILGGAARKASALDSSGPTCVNGLIQRMNGAAHIGTLAGSARRQHFRATAASYIAWHSKAGDIRASTAALTRRQQASRAFAAELIAPRQYLQERAAKYGFTEEEIEQEAGTLTAPYDTVLWQAWRAGALSWDVEFPAPRPNSLF